VRRWARLAALGGLAVAAIAVIGGAGWLLTLPGVGDAPRRAQAILATHHEPARLVAPPARLAAAVVSTEDEHFYDNFVVNVASGVGRAAVDAVETGQDPGGSTIDQQLAKLLYGDGAGLGATLRAIGLGIKLSLTYSHAEMLRMYVNAAYYGQGYWGLAAAARGYFGVAPARLTWGEAAMLAGLLQAPSAYDPVTDLPLARERERHVLDQLVANGYRTRAQAAAAYAARLPLS
jgi:penicillin-binding protein 1A